MATFCPTCGLENQPDRNFCRSCGTNLRLVKQALELNAPAPVPLDPAQATKKHVTELLLKRISELPINEPGDLEEVIGQIGRLLESDDAQKVRHVRNGIITVAIVAGVLGFFGLAFLAGTGAPTGMILGVVSLFLAVVVPILLFMLYQLGKPLRPPGAPETKFPMTSGEPITPPQPVRPTPTSVTEHTTQHLDDVAYRPAQREKIPPQ